MEPQPRLFEIPKKPESTVSQGSQHPESSAVTQPVDPLAALRNERDAFSEQLDKAHSFGFGDAVYLEGKIAKIDEEIRKLSPEPIPTTHDNGDDRIRANAIR